MKDIVLVLGLAMCLGVQAQASLWWTAEGGSDPADPFGYLIGDVFAFTLNSDEPATGVRIGAITDHNATGGFTGCAIHPAFSVVGSPGVLVKDWDYVGSFHPIEIWYELDPDDLVWIEAVSMGETTTTGILTLHYTAGTRTGDVLISALGDPTGLLGIGADVMLVSGPVPMPDIELHHIPEPAALGLLLAGGLAVLRKRT